MRITWRSAGLVGYALLLVASHGWQALRSPTVEPEPAEVIVTLPALGGERAARSSVDVVVRDLGPRVGAPVLVLLHGAPGDGGNFEGMVRHLPGVRVLAPDLPGFGRSSHDLPDYSSRTHARYVLALLDALEIPSAHWLGFSMGGAVALHAAELAPARVRSITLLASIGVQEHELLGNYTLNHLVHGLQLGALWLVDHGVPHMGLLGRGPFDQAYARNFFDSDQRPLRGVLHRYPNPLLILHGRDDPLVPFAAAREHHRLVPHAEMQVFDSGHFLPFQHADEVASRVQEFIVRVDAGEARTRADQTPEERKRAAAPFDPRDAGPQGAIGFAVFVLLVLAASLVSEDLTCIGVGLLVGNGQLEFATGAATAIAALWIGDSGLYAAGRTFGARLLRSRRIQRVIPQAALDRLADRLRRSGFAVILTSRFIPGTRLPTYLGAGLVRYPFPRFAAYLAVGALIWTPVLVGLAAALGMLAVGYFAAFQRYALVGVVLAAGISLGLVRFVVPLVSFRGRRLALGRWCRFSRWEFWPRWRFYPPIVLWIGWLALRHRSLAVVTAVNPAIPGGGLIGESKWAILAGLAASPEFVARGALLSAGTDRAAATEVFLRDHGLDYPVVLKPDVGDRGKDVEIVRDAIALRTYLDAHSRDTIVQEFVDGLEFGVFYALHPGASMGEVISIAEKRPLVVTGDGNRTLEELILADDRAVCMAPMHLQTHAKQLGHVVSAGAQFRLTQLGTHSRGSLFLDAGEHRTPALVEQFDRISRGYAGFFFGRYDVRTPDLESFRAGRAFKVLELNGLTSEAAHVYDPKNRLFEAYRVLFDQWSRAFEIGAANRACGAQPLTVLQGLRLLQAARRR